MASPRADDPIRNSDRLPIEGKYRCQDCRRPSLVFSEKRAVARTCGYCGGTAVRVG